MPGRGNRKHKVNQEITKNKEEPLTSQLVLKVTKSLLEKIKSQEQWQNLVREAITEKLAQIENIKTRKLKEGSLLSEEELTQCILESIGDGVIATDMEGEIQECNPAAERLLGWKKEEIKQHPWTEIFRLLDESTRQPITNLIERVLQQKQIIRLENSVVLLARDETEYAVSITASPISSRKNQLIGVVLIISDHTQSRQLTRQLSWQASHDPLTELLNRQAFEQRVEEALNDAKLHQKTHTLGYLDLDQFKMINDSCGHVAGDDLLRQLSKLLQQRIRSADTLARLGGDEFGLLLLNCPIEEGERIAQTLRQSVENFSFTWEQQTFTIGVSIGLVPIDAESPDVTTLVDTADTACYAAKSRGRNRIHTYHTDEGELNLQQQPRNWVSRINEALEENRFCLYMQQITPMTPELGVEHYEVLLRLLDEQGNLVLPGDFLPAAERYHLMPVIDKWVVENFFNYYIEHYQAYSRQTSEETNILYSLNISGISLNNEDFLNFLRIQLARPYIRPQSICFEITESSAIANLSQAKFLIDTLRQLGCRFALDDVGSEIKSLAYLKNLSIDYLKINGNLIQNLLIDAVDYTFVDCFNRIGHALGIQTIAEFVEHQSFLEPLRTIGVDYVQGYGIARPVPLSFTN